MMRSHSSSTVSGMISSLVNYSVNSYVPCIVTWGAVQVGGCIVSVRSYNKKYSVGLFLCSLGGSFLGCASRWCRFAGSFPANKRRFGCVGSYL
jgi:hypothetical protein